MLTVQVDWHLSSGLAVVFIEAPEKIPENSKVPQVLYDQCAHWGLPTSGNVVGLNSTTDFTGQTLGPYPLKMVRPLLPIPSVTISLAHPLSFTSLLHFLRHFISIPLGLEREESNEMLIRSRIGHQKR